jgi:hypothetical protein
MRGIHPLLHQMTMVVDACWGPSERPTSTAGRSDTTRKPDVVRRNALRTLVRFAGCSGVVISFCRLNSVTPGGAYTFSPTPLESDARGVETIDTGVRAFERREAIATQLRQSGLDVRPPERTALSDRRRVRKLPGRSGLRPIVHCDYAVRSATSAAAAPAEPSAVVWRCQAAEGLSTHEDDGEHPATTRHMQGSGRNPQGKRLSYEALASGVVTTRVSRAVRSNRFKFQQSMGDRLLQCRSPMRKILLRDPCGYRRCCKVSSRRRSAIAQISEDDLQRQLSQSASWGRD